MIPTLSSCCAAAYASSTAASTAKASHATPADTATAESQRSNAVEHEAPGAAALAPAPQRHDGHRLAANGARLDSQDSRRLWTAQDLGTHLTDPQAHAAPGEIGPAVRDLPGVP